MPNVYGYSRRWTGKGKPRGKQIKNYIVTSDRVVYRYVNGTWYIAEPTNGKMVVNAKVVDYEKFIDDVRNGTYKE